LSASPETATLPPRAGGVARARSRACGRRGGSGDRARPAAREQVGFVITFDKNAIAAATDITRANPGPYTALVWWQERAQPRWPTSSGPASPPGSGGGTVPPRKGIVSAEVPHEGRAIWGFVTMMVAWNIALDLKYVVQRARPVVTDPVSSAPGYSFLRARGQPAAAATPSSS
jgi:undecaprenyl-diphosphatase